MTYEFFELTAQTATAHWAWTIAFFLWFIGLAGMGLFLNAWVRSKTVFYISTAASIVGTLLVVSHLARMLNLPFAAFNALVEWKFNFTSWMFIGICLLAVMCVETVIVSWMLSRSGGEKLLESAGLRWFNAVLGVAATAYSGFLLTQAAGIPLWNTAVLPVLWIFSGLACAVGTVELLAASGRLDRAKLSWLPTTANCVHIGEAFVIFAFVQVALSGTPGAAASAHSLLTGSNAAMFWGGALLLGIAVPLLAGFVKSRTAALAGGACAIAGALFLRACVLFAGYFDPTFIG